MNLGYHLLLAALWVLMGLLLGLKHCPAAEPDGFAVGTILGSDHWSDDPDDPKNEDHWPSIYVGVRYDIHQYSGGYVINSDNNDALFFLYGQRVNRYMSVVIGGVTNYDDMPFRPSVGLSFSFGPIRVSPMIAVTTYGLEYRWSPNGQ